MNTEMTNNHSDFLTADEDLIESVISTEWQQFDRVQNEGGRADCQDDWITFHIMRKSQFSTWNHDTLKSYQQDLANANRNNRNLLTEKYARMMAGTAPEKYKQLEHRLPALSQERIRLQEELIAIYVRWTEEFALSHPQMSMRSRPIRTIEDTCQITSSETYLRGEISTYSDKTFSLFARHVFQMDASGSNLVLEIMNVTAALYGYKDADDAEQQMR